MAKLSRIVFSPFRLIFWPFRIGWKLSSGLALKTDKGGEIPGGRYLITLFIAGAIYLAVARIVLLFMPIDRAASTRATESAADQTSAEAAPGNAVKQAPEPKAVDDDDDDDD